MQFYADLLFRRPFSGIQCVACGMTKYLKAHAHCPYMLVQNGEGRCDYLIALGEFIPVTSKCMLERMDLCTIKYCSEQELMVLLDKALL